MTGYLKLCVTVYWLALILWVSALVSVAVAAMNVFGTLGPMMLELAEYSAFPLEEHGRLAAGQVMDGVFVVADLLQVLAAPIVIVTLLVQLVIFRLPWRRPANLVRLVCILGATALVAHHVGVVAPRMNGELRAFRTAAAAGDAPAAAGHRLAFERDHGPADTRHRVRLLLLVTAVVASATALSPAVPTTAARDATAPPKPSLIPERGAR